MNFTRNEFLSLVCGIVICVAGPLLAMFFRDRWLDPVLGGLSHEAQHQVLFLLTLLIGLFGALCGWVFTIVPNTLFYEFGQLQPRIRMVMAELGAIVALIAVVVHSLLSSR